MRSLKILALCLGAAFVCAFAFVVMLRFSLPPTDEAYGVPLSQLFSDPFVFFGAVYGAVFFGLISFPFAYFAVRKVRLAPAALFIFGTVLGEILFVTPFLGPVGLFGAVLTLAVALFICRFSRWQIFATHPQNPAS